ERRPTPQRRRARAARRAADALRARLRLRSEHVALRLARLRGGAPDRPVRPRRRRRLGRRRLRPRAPWLAAGLRRRRARALRRARPRRRRLRRALRQRDDRGPGGCRGAVALRPARARRPLAALRGRRRLHGRLQRRGHRRAARVARRELPGVVERDRAGDHGHPGPARARGGAHEHLLPRRPRDRRAVRAGHLPLRQPRRPRPREDAEPGAAVSAGRDRAAGRGRVRPPAPPRQPLRGARLDGALPEPQRARRDRRGDPGLPLRV
ncbi:MAG: Hydrolase of unknown specificity RsbQ, part of a novel [RsbQ - PAS domain] bacterial sensing module, partial [uncultured Solirubrobacteraceae bacterium]